MPFHSTAEWQATVSRRLQVSNASDRIAVAIEVQWTLSMWQCVLVCHCGMCAETSYNASLAPRLQSDARSGGNEHWEGGRGLFQRLKALPVWTGPSEPRSAFPVGYRRTDFGVDGPFTRRECTVEWGSMG
eukprot:331027-Chlamydomonas_euryale.AAC.2